MGDQATGYTVDLDGLDGVTGSLGNVVKDLKEANGDYTAALDDGKPVPIATGDGAGGFHEMVIVARDGDRYQVWNPWGRSEWVTRDQFPNSQLNAGHLTGNSNLNRAYGVELPK